LIESIVSNGGTAGQVWLGDLQLVGEYAIKDGFLTWDVEEYYRKSLIEQGLWEFYHTEVMPLYRECTIEMEWKGVQLDVPFIEQTKLAIEADIALLEQQVREKIAPHLDLFNSWYLAKSYTPKSSGEFAQAACRFYNIELPKTKNGAFSFAAKAKDALPDSVFKRFIMEKHDLPDEAGFGYSKANGR
jgi:hypothetical protein